MGRPRVLDWHGTIRGYRNHGCHCIACRTAHSAAVKSWRHRARAERDRATTPIRVDAAPVMAHIAALVASGMTLTEVAALAGVGKATVARIARGDRVTVLSRVAACIATVDPLPNLDGYVDPVVVERLVTGYPHVDWRTLSATRCERLEVLRRLDYREQRAALRARGYGDQQIDLPAFDSVRAWLGLNSRDAAAVQAAS